MSLVSKITKAIDKHNKSHPKMTVGEIYTAFSEILDALSEGLAICREHEQAKREPTPVRRFFRQHTETPKLAVVQPVFFCCENDPTCHSPCPLHPHYKTVDSGGKAE